MSNLTYKIPQENILLIKPSQVSDEYFGMVEDMWYSEMIRHLPRQVIDSLDVLTRQDFSGFFKLSEKEADQRQFAGNTDLLRLL